MSNSQAKVGQLFEAVVHDMASDGRGVVNHPSGRTFFIAGVWLEEKIKAEVTELKGRIGMAKCIEVIESSEHRVDPPCTHHGFSSGKVSWYKCC